MHEAARAWVETHAAGVWYDVLEVGSRDINGGIRDLIATDEFHGIDIVDGPGVDEVADVRDHDGQYHLVVCCEVLEHDREPADLVRHCWRQVRPGGRLIVTCAGPGREPHSAHDGGPVRDGEHYANVDSTIALAVDVWPTHLDVADGDVRVVWDRA